MQLGLHFRAWKFLGICCFHKGWPSKRKGCFLIGICALYILTNYIAELHDLFIFLREPEMTLSGAAEYMQDCTMLLHFEQRYVLASNIYVHFNLSAHFSPAVPLVMIEISFIMASFKGHPALDKKTEGEKSSRGMGSKLICQENISMIFFVVVEV